MNLRLRAYRFPPAADFEGQLAGALERMQLIGGAELRDLLFVMRDARTSEPLAIDLSTAGADGTFAALLDFRLDERRRRDATARTLAPETGGVDRAVVEDIAATLEPGGALLAVLSTGGPVPALEDAAGRTGGRRIADEPVGAARIADLVPGVLASMARSHGPAPTASPPIHTP